MRQYVYLPTKLLPKISTYWYEAIFPKATTYSADEMCSTPTPRALGLTASQVSHACIVLAHAYGYVNVACQIRVGAVRAVSSGLWAVICGGEIDVYIV